MRILWITNDPIRSQIEPGKSSSGFWKEALYHLLKEDINTELIVAYPDVQKEKLNEHNFSFRYPFKKRFDTIPKNTLADLLWIISETQQDLIHVHGTEMPYGLISKYTAIPVVISLQGFISEWYNSLLGDIALYEWNKYKTLKEYIKRNSYPDMHTQWFLNSACEKEIVRSNKYFIGRTNFDKYFVYKSNPNGIYFTGNELLRDNFFKSNWDIKKIKRHTIYTSLFINPVKGFHVLLEAVHYLKAEFPDIQIQVAGKLTDKMKSPILGNSYFRYLDHLIEKFNLHQHVDFKGKLEGNEIAEILEKTHVFALPSFMENSSNAMGEAQITGVPCVVSNCGGTVNIIKDYENGLIFNRGNAYELAVKIREVFINDDLAQSLSAYGKIAGSAFHNKQMIFSQYISIYQKIIALES